MHHNPRQNRSVFKSLLNCTSEMSLSRNVTGREFKRHGPATEKLLSLRFSGNKSPSAQPFNSSLPILSLSSPLPSLLSDPLLFVFSFLPRQPFRPVNPSLHDASVNSSSSSIANFAVERYDIDTSTTDPVSCFSTGYVKSIHTRAA